MLLCCRGACPLAVPQGANFTAAMAFEMASTNLVVELSTIMLVLLGWQFTSAEFIGAPVMVGLLVLLFRRFLKRLSPAAQAAEWGEEKAGTVIALEMEEPSIQSSVILPG